MGTRLEERRRAGWLKRLGVAVLCACWPALSVAATPLVAIFPLQDVTRSKNDVNLPFTRQLSERLAEAGTDVTSQTTVISFMANNRIRTVGQLESYQISKIREDLGAAFILLGTVTQAKEKPNPSLGLTLSLVRTSDARTVWSYVGHVSTADARKILGLGEPNSLPKLEPLLAQEVVSRWPWDLIGRSQQGGPVGLEAVVLRPARVRPGAEVYASIRLRDEWRGERAPRAFFKADDQLHAASLSADGSVYEASWVAGEKDGRFPVTLVLEWPLYGRTENALLGTYLVDGTPPMLALDFVGPMMLGGTPTFRSEAVLRPRLLISKPLARWRFGVRDEAGNPVAEIGESGRLPERFQWRGQGRDDAEGLMPDGVYEAVLEVWDEAGNPARTSRKFGLNRSLPRVEIAAHRNDQELAVDLESKGKVPLAFWRMEMWSEEGKLLKTAEGTELPVRVGVERSSARDEEKIRAILVVRDVMGNTERREVGDVFGAVRPQAPAKPETKAKEAPAKGSQKWVEEF
ncbi:MAG: hypothetical protein HY900_09855 [Deltaproteobacteria bacterium]|nr:hypothetical protein [Deltaproteobacteria bacterium]